MEQGQQGQQGQQGLQVSEGDRVVLALGAVSIGALKVYSEAHEAFFGAMAEGRPAETERKALLDAALAFSIAVYYEVAEGPIPGEAWNDPEVVARAEREAAELGVST